MSFQSLKQDLVSDCNVTSRRIEKKFLPSQNLHCSEESSVQFSHSVVSDSL